MSKFQLIATTLFIFCLSFFVCSLFRGYDPDLWGHLKFGEYIVSNMAISYKDIYAFTPTKDLWVNHEWLFEITSYLLLSLNKNGFFLLLFKGFTYSLAILIPWLYMVKKERFNIVNFFVFLLIIFSFAYGTAIRPQIFSYLFFALTLLILETDSLKGKLSYIGLPVIFVLWVNSHGGVMAGLAFVYAWSFLTLVRKVFFSGSFERDQQGDPTHPPPGQNGSMLAELKIFTLPVVLTLLLAVNPYFLDYYPYIIDAISMKRPFVEEWGSVLANPGMFKFFIVLSVVASMCVIFAFRQKNAESIVRMLLLFVLMVMAYKHIRHIPFFAIACGFYLPEVIKFVVNKYFPPKPDSVQYSVAPVAIICAAIALLCFTFYGEKGLDYSLEIKEKTDYQHVGYPVQTVEYMKQNKLTGNMMTNFNWGEFIIYQLTPEVKVSIDGRYETVYPHQVVEDNMIFINAKPGWQKILDKYQPDYVLLSKFDPVSKPMLTKSNWPVIFKNKESCLFINPQTMFKLLQKNNS